MYICLQTFTGKSGGVCSLTFNFTTEIQCTTTLVPLYHKHTQIFSSNRFITNCIPRGEYRHSFIQVPGRKRHSATTGEYCCCITSYVQCICSKGVLDLHSLPTRTTCKIIIRNLPAVWITDITVAVNARRIFTACEAISNCTNWEKPERRLSFYVIRHAFFSFTKHTHAAYSPNAMDSIECRARQRLSLFACTSWLAVVLLAVYSQISRGQQEARLRCVSV